MVSGDFEFLKFTFQYDHIIMYKKTFYDCFINYNLLFQNTSLSYPAAQPNYSSQPQSYSYGSRCTPEKYDSW